jgi:membrane-associated phospholipid phosphatase
MQMGKKSKVRKAAEAEHAASARAAALRDSPAMTAIGKASEIADQPPLIAISAGVLALGVVMRQRSLARAGVRMLASHLVATGIKTVLKNRVDRTRPAQAIARGKPRVKRGHGAEDTTENSFPSGHTAGAVAVAEAVAREAPSGGLPVRLLAASIGSVQLPRGAHYGSDVIAGAAIGWIAEKIASAAIDLAEATLRRRRVAASPEAEAEAEAHPS